MLITQDIIGAVSHMCRGESRLSAGTHFCGNGANKESVRNIPMPISATLTISNDNARRVVS
jgi:hypothetical protein